MGKSARIHFEPELDGYGFEEGATFVSSDDGTMTVSVAEEKAVDSYNESFTCTITMTKEQAVTLRDWLRMQY